MNWRKTAILASSLAIMGAGITVPATNASADEKSVKVTLPIRNNGAYVADVCARDVTDSSASPVDLACKAHITAGETVVMEFTMPAHHTLEVLGNATLGKTKARYVTLGDAGETHCFLFSGTIIIGFKFREIWGCEGF